MKKYNTFLRWSLLGGSIYFFLIAAAHLFRIKIPMLFIYFNVPSYTYQDMIISFLAFGWGMFLFAGYKSSGERELVIVRYIIIAGFAAIAGLIFINTATDFKKFNQDIIRGYFWIETIFILIYIIWLMLLYWKARGNSKQNDRVISYQEILNNEQKELLRKQ